MEDTDQQPTLSKRARPPIMPTSASLGRSTAWGESKAGCLLVSMRLHRRRKTTPILRVVRSKSALKVRSTVVRQSQGRHSSTRASSTTVALGTSLLRTQGISRRCTTVAVVRQNQGGDLRNPMPSQSVDCLLGSNVCLRWSSRDRPRVI